MKIEIPQEVLTQTIEALRELQLRLELESDAFTRIQSREGAIRAEERLEQAEVTRQLFEFYVHL